MSAAALLVRPAAPGIRQEAAAADRCRAGQRNAAPDGLAERIEATIRAKLVVATRVIWCPNGSLPRSEYKTSW